MGEILEAVKLALRIMTDAFNDELMGLIHAAVLDLQVAGVKVDLSDYLARRAIITYCKMHFGEPDEYNRLKASFDEQKAQMSMATGYTVWTDQPDSNS